MASGEVARIEAILRDYLSFARPMSELRPVETDLGALAFQLAAVFESRAERSAITLSIGGAAFAAPPAVIYDSVPNPLPGNVVSQPYQAAQMSQLPGCRRNSRS